jgi:tRNA (mo5U34)-methyltransferase
LGADNCHYIRGSVYDLSPEQNGSFDIVLFLGLIYHLRHPLLALDRIYDVAKSKIYVDSPTIDTSVLDRTLSEEQRIAIVEQGRVVHALPMAYFTKGAETGDAYNWFIPNQKALVAFLEASGFVVDHSFVDHHGWMSVSATKGARSFTPGLEGWNEAASRRRHVR